jgi:hypothetical protein
MAYLRALGVRRKFTQPKITHVLKPKESQYITNNCHKILVNLQSGRRK